MGGILSAAHSCPAFHAVPPRPPQRKPLRPSLEPPCLTLPSSPMFETELSASRGKKEGSSPKAELSRSLSTYAGFSYPGMSKLLQMPSLSKGSKAISFDLKSIDTKSSHNSKLSSSPTVFEILKHASLASGTRNLPPPSFTQSARRDSGQDDLDLQFDLTLEDSKGDGSGTGGSMLPSLLT
eukprot:CAMPEP_0167761768 /NCGR_PEP_ID=MMETSP0110_2-20121227/12364_1 /TAXON_ID=629695 /ORGANISM="Gymnochlora sp., Strain CCMP2014" /LENGTH=180 /DNA_ID=CAMNT_0007648505 /DNA_START=153 /DNA_END=695 /DNA_ORIENTATION=+